MKRVILSAWLSMRYTVGITENKPQIHCHVQQPCGIMLHTARPTFQMKTRVERGQETGQGHTAGRCKKDLHWGLLSFSTEMGMSPWLCTRCPKRLPMTAYTA